MAAMVRVSIVLQMSRGKSSYLDRVQVEDIGGYLLVPPFQQMMSTRLIAASDCRVAVSTR